ncbi:unnamed protein product [Caenorhabditis brenneri]
MSQTFSKRWTTEPEYIELLNCLINKTKEAKSPINIHEFVRDFKEKSGTALRESCLKSRIHRLRNIVHSFDHIETDTKVRMLFALSVPVNGDFFKKLSNDAHVVVDGNNRITQYKSKSLELNGFHRLLTARDTKHYWTTDMECIELLNYLIEETENVTSPMNLAQLARDFKEKSGALQTAGSLEQRIIQVRYIIHSFEHIDREEKVKLLFALSVPVNAQFLEELNKDAFVEVDEMNRITYYKTINDGMKLSGDHSLTAKVSTAHFDSELSHRPPTVHRSSPCLIQMSQTISKRWTTDPEYTELLNCLITQTKDAKSPIKIHEFVRDFKEKSGTALTDTCIKSRIKRMRAIIHSFDHVDTDTKVRMLFALSVPVNKDFLKKLSNDALVEVDENNRITMYKSERLELNGYHRLSTVRDSKVYWTTDMECNLINYLIEATENVKSPISLAQLARDFKEKTGAFQTAESLEQKIMRVRFIIQSSSEHIDKNTKVKLLFALSAGVYVNVLEELEKNAFVEVDNELRITHYKANDGSLELRGDHSHSAKTENEKLQSKRSLRSMINRYFEKKINPNAVPDNGEEKEMGNLIEFITEKCDNANTPLRIRRLAKNFVDKFKTSTLPDTVSKRIKGYGQEIQRVEFLTIRSRVKQLFGLSATVDSDLLERLRTEALVKIDEKNRITYYKANDESLELRGDHSASAKKKTASLESNRTYQSMIIDYFEKKNDAVPYCKEEKEMWKLIEFITEECEKVDSPLSICQLTEDFNKHFGLSSSLDCIHNRINAYCREIQTSEILDAFSTVKQLFCLSATLDTEYLGKLRKDAVVEVDILKRITKFVANNGRLILNRDPSLSAEGKLGWIEWKKKNTAVERNGHSGDDTEDDSDEGDGYSDNASDEYSSKEFDSDFDLNNYNNHLEPSNEAVDFDDDIPVLSPICMSMEDYFDFDPRTDRSYRSDEIEMREDEGNYFGIIGNAAKKTRKFETIPKSQACSSTSCTSKTSKRTVDASAGSTSSKRTKPPSKESMNPREMNDNFSYDDPSKVELKPFRGPIGLSDEIEEDSDIEQMPRKLTLQDKKVPVSKVDSALSATLDIICT